MDGGGNNNNLRSPVLLESKQSPIYMYKKSSHAHCKVAQYWPICTYDIPSSGKLTRVRSRGGTKCASFGFSILHLRGSCCRFCVMDSLLSSWGLGTLFQPFYLFRTLRHMIQSYDLPDLLDETVRPINTLTTVKCTAIARWTPGNWFFSLDPEMLHSLNDKLQRCDWIDGVVWYRDFAHFDAPQLFNRYGHRALPVSREDDIDNDLSEHLNKVGSSPSQQMSSRCLPCCRCQRTLIRPS